MSVAAPAPTAPRRRAWIQVLLLSVVAGMLLAGAVGAAVHYATGRNTLLPVLAIVLILSGIRLVGVAVDAIQRVRANAAAGDALPPMHGYGWVVYKLVAALVAFGGAAYLLLASDAARLERFFN